MSAPSYRHAGPRWVLLGSLMLALALAPILLESTAGATAPPGTPVLRQSAELVSTPLGTGRGQGQDVALSADGSTLAVAAVTYNRPSAVVVYVRSGGRWVTETTLRSPGGYDYWWGYGVFAIAISADGSTVAVGNTNATVWAGGTSVHAAGQVDLFTRSGQEWRAAGHLVAPHPREFGWFGLDVSLSGDGTKVAVSDTWGHAYIADARSRVMQELPGPGGNSFGYSVAISPDGETIVVGAPNGVAHPGRGAAFVLVDDPVSGWTQRWQVEASPDQEENYFGAAVAVTDTDTVVVGAFGSRAVSVYDRRGPALVRTATFTPRYSTQGSDLGWSVAVSADGSTVVAGARSRNSAGGSIVAGGAGYRWVRSAGGWSWAGLLSVPHPNAYEAQGTATAVSGDGRVVVLGAPGRRSPSLSATGAAIVFSAVP